MSTYHELLVYKNSYKLAVIIHKISLKLPKEMVDVSYQVRRCSRSIPTNIAEGYGRCKSTKDRINFIQTSLGSNDEMIVHLRFIRDLSYLDVKLIDTMIDAYVINGKRINNLIKFNKKLLNDKPVN